MNILYTLSFLLFTSFDAIAAQSDLECTSSPASFPLVWNGGDLGLLPVAHTSYTLVGTVLHVDTIAVEGAILNAGDAPDGNFRFWIQETPFTSTPSTASAIRNGKVPNAPGVDCPYRGTKCSFSVDLATELDFDFTKGIYVHIHDDSDGSVSDGQGGPYTPGEPTTSTGGDTAMDNWFQYGKIDFDCSVPNLKPWTNWHICEAAEDCQSSCCSKEYSNGVLKCHPTGSSSECLKPATECTTLVASLETWSICSSSNECLSSCCSSEYSNGQFKCHPTGSSSKCIPFQSLCEQPRRDWSTCVESEDCMSGCCSGEFSGGVMKCHPAGTSSSCRESGPAFARL